MYEFFDNFDEWVERYWDTLPNVKFWYDKIPFEGKLVDQLEEEDGYTIVAIRDDYTLQHEVFVVENSKISYDRP